MSYYNLEQTLKILQESLPDTSLPFDLPQLAHLCRQGVLTPIFAYARHAIEVVEDKHTGKHPEWRTTSFYDGYLTHKSLLSLLDNNEDKLDLYNAMTYEKDGKGYEVVLVANPLNIRKYLSDEDYSVYSDDDDYTVTRESLLFSSEQVRSYIALKQTAEQNTPKQQLIDRLESQIADLKKQLEERNDTPANSALHSNTDIQNVKKAAIKQFNISLAKALIKLDYQDNLRKGDIVDFIIPYMKELTFILADKDEKKAANLTVSHKTLYDTHLQGMDFKAGRQSNEEKKKVNIELLFKKQSPATE